MGKLENETYQALGSELERFKAGLQEGELVGTGHRSWHKSFGWVGPVWPPEVDLKSKL